MQVEVLVRVSCDVAPADEVDAWRSCEQIADRNKHPTGAIGFDVGTDSVSACWRLLLRPSSGTYMCER